MEAAVAIGKFKSLDWIGKFKSLDWINAFVDDKVDDVARRFLDVDGVRTTSCGRKEVATVLCLMHETAKARRTQV